MSLDSPPRPRGRPRIHAPDDRQQVNVRLSRAEVETLRRAAEAAGMTLSAWLRMVGLREAQRRPSGLHHDPELYEPQG